MFSDADIPINNDRYLKMSFDVKEASVLHGFSGYFDTVLYDDITLSKLLYLIEKKHLILHHVFTL